MQQNYEMTEKDAINIITTRILYEKTFIPYTKDQALLLEDKNDKNQLKLTVEQREKLAQKLAEAHRIEKARKMNYEKEIRQQVEQQL